MFSATPLVFVLLLPGLLSFTIGDYITFHHVLTQQITVERLLRVRYSYKCWWINGEKPDQSPHLIKLSSQWWSLHRSLDRLTCSVESKADQKAKCSWAQWRQLFRPPMGVASSYHVSTQLCCSPTAARALTEAPGTDLPPGPSAVLGTC